MIRGMYTAASGMLVQAQRTDIISNNLANVDTVGYHRQAGHVRAFPDMLLSRMDGGGRSPVGSLGTGAVVDGGRHSFKPGRLHETGNDLDFALLDFGFFAVAHPEGTRYTQDGRFSLNESGWLVTQNGYRVLGERGPIHLEPGAMEVNSRGEIYVDGRFQDRFLVVEFNDRDGLRRLGENLYQAQPEAGDPFRFNTVVAQGVVESSNVNVIREMVNMIEVHRAYEANQKVIQAHDETLGKAVNEIVG